MIKEDMSWLHWQNSLYILWVENGLNQYTSEPDAGKRNEQTNQVIVLGGRRVNSQKFTAAT